MSNEAMRVYCGNIPFDATEKDLADFFADAGFDVEDVKVITDRDTGKSKGFGFATFADPQAAAKAIAELKDENFLGRRINLAEAQSKQRSGIGPTQAWKPGSPGAREAGEQRVDRQRNDRFPRSAPEPRGPRRDGGRR